MICDQDDIAEVKQLMSIVVPDSVFLESSGNSGGMVWTVSMSHIHQLGAIFAIMEGSSSASPDLKLSDK